MYLLCIRVLASNEMKEAGTIPGSVAPVRSIRMFAAICSVMPRTRGTNLKVPFQTAKSCKICQK